ncbi:MAG: glycoside hydrolase family 27 protein [Lachnospiraceae bacterium]|nr:glycoside hydrolase family 27 protein [Lachnospiraceae bacterium]
MRLNTSRISPEKIESKEYAYPSFNDGKPFSEKKTGRLPAMGWNSWNAFGSGNTEALTKAMADKILELGLDKLGYEYLVLDDGCYKQERVDGKLSNEEVKFPSGFKALADYIHGKGLKFGMYNDIGTNLCAGAQVGTCGHEETDAKSYVEWGIDFLKVDNCYYLWDNATFSNGENARFSFAPDIASIKVKGDDFEIVKEAASGKITGQGPWFDGKYVTNIGTFDGTNTGTTPVGERSGELELDIKIPKAGEYSLFVEYRSGKRNGCGEWLQIALGDKEHENRIYDELVTSSTDDKDSILEVKCFLKEGNNIIRLMNHRRQENTLNAYATMFYALQNAAPRNDIQLSICEWGKTQPQNWGYKIGNSWRILNDITFCVGSDRDFGRGEWDNPGTQSIVSQYNKAVIMDRFAGLEKGWNDPDMMVIGMNDVDETMCRTHMSMWCMMNSPLMLGLDLRRVKKDDWIYNIIANENLISLNQDALGVQSRRIYSSILENEAPDLTYITNNDRVDILAKPLSNGDIALAFYNLSREDKPESYQISIEEIVKMIGEEMVNKVDWLRTEKFVAMDLFNDEKTIIDEKIVRVDGIKGCDNVTLRLCIA